MKGGKVKREREEWNVYSNALNKEEEREGRKRISTWEKETKNGKTERKRRRIIKPREMERD